MGDCVHALMLQSGRRWDWLTPVVVQIRCMVLGQYLEKDYICAGHLLADRLQVRFDVRPMLLCVSSVLPPTISVVGCLHRLIL